MGEEVLDETWISLNVVNFHEAEDLKITDPPRGSRSQETIG